MVSPGSLSQGVIHVHREVSGKQQAAMRSMTAELDALRPKAQTAKERYESLQAEVQTAHDQAAAAQETTTAAESKARADMKVGQAKYQCPIGFPGQCCCIRSWRQGSTSSRSTPCSA